MYKLLLLFYPDCPFSKIHFVLLQPAVFPLQPEPPFWVFLLELVRNAQLFRAGPSRSEQLQHFPGKRCWEALAKRRGAMQMGKGSTPCLHNVLGDAGGTKGTCPQPVALKGIKRKNGRRNYFSALCAGSTVERDVSSAGQNVARRASPGR